MSVRRLADPSVQPESFTFTPENLDWAEKKIAEYPAGRQQSAVIPVLWRAQEQQGWVSRAAIEEVGRLLDMAYIRVLEIATFYTQFQLKPVGSNAHIQVCGTTPCMLRGAEDLRSVCQRKINHDPFETNSEGTMSWEEVECLGACVNAPMVMIGKDTYEDLTPDKLEAIIDKFAAGQGDSVQPGPQIERKYGAAEGGATTLLETPTAERTYKAFPPPEDKPAEKPAAPAPKPAAEEKPAPSGDAENAPTKPGRKNGEVPDEAAPALKTPGDAPKASYAKTEAVREENQEEADADGEPNDAMRPGATGGESEAAKIDDGDRDGEKHDAPGSDRDASAESKSGATDGPAAQGTAKTGAKADADAPIFTAPAGDRDDLKLISGVGPVLERKLNELGITTWSQVAAMNDADIEKLESRLNFKGRVARDRWIEQGKVLASGGVEEYRRVFGKGPR
ncbi:NADH-quinone oxidoreductase subunit NuoE [Devosia sp.]|uniref:NADH-quinone oxidoreductase subunit NuoE n=1 Tax=Devosia sp. TaxID=1871048 RepID=UPI003A925AAB